jgi:hypothetical protein
MLTSNIIISRTDSINSHNIINSKDSLKAQLKNKINKNKIIVIGLILILIGDSLVILIIMVAIIKVRIILQILVILMEVFQMHQIATKIILNNNNKI